MAGRAVSLGGWAGWAVLALLGLVCLAPLAALLAVPGDWAGAYGRAVLRFTMWQALLSALISVALAVPLAGALVRQNFRGKSLVITVLGAPFLLPVVVAVFGLLAVWGRSGWIASLIGQPLDIYGLPGLVLAHVFFNLPLATRLILQGWAAIPVEHIRLAAQLGLNWRAQWRILGLPVLRATAPGAFLVVFLFCISSFAAALILGGGPAATTVELAIYQALRFDFNLGGAARLALIQLGLSLGFGLVALHFVRPSGFGSGLILRAIQLPATPLRIWIDWGFILSAGVFLGLPMLAIAARGMAGLAALPAATLPALGRSMAVALGSGALAVMAALALSLLILRLRPRRGRLLEAAVMLALIASPFVMGTGLFILLNPVIDPARIALLLTGLVNAALILPLLLRLFLPALGRINSDFGQLALMTGFRPSAQLRFVTVPLMQRELGLGMGLAVALSMGDLGVITLFSGPDAGTLPLLMQRLMGSYRMDQAAGVGVVLVASTLALFKVFDGWGARNGH